MVKIITFRILCFRSVFRSAWISYKIEKCHGFIPPPANTYG